jgi:hypothetical protein
MFADPQVGKRYRQEFYLNEAEDEARVIKSDATVEIKRGHFSAVLQTEDFSRLDPGTREHKFYAPGIGMVLEEKVAAGKARWNW